MSEVTLQENVMEFLDDVHRYLIGLILCVIAMGLVGSVVYVLGIIIDVLTGSSKWK
jgi:hypothetical protein